MSDEQIIRLTVEQEQDYAFRIRFDETSLPDLLTDEPSPLGTDTGPNPSRLLLAAVANCLTASLLFALRKFKNQPGPLVTTATARMGRNEQGRLRVEHIQCDVKLAEAAADHASMERILAQFENFCVVTESVRNGVDVTISVSDAGGNLLHGKRAG